MTAPPHSVFVVDDEEPILNSISLFLGLHGYTVHVFSSAESFLKSYRPEWIGWLFVDMRMPAMSGLDLIAELTRRRTSLSLVLMTGHESAAGLEQSLGMDAVILEKPFSAEDLQAIIESQNR